MAFIKTRKQVFTPVKKELLTPLDEVSKTAVASHNGCAFCKHSVTLPLCGGEYIRVCKKKIGCDDFIPVED